MTYSQASGIFATENWSIVGYSGHGDGLNNPSMQNVKGIGPIPQGRYTIAPPHVDSTVGPVAMRLKPAAENEMFGRGDFLIHGYTSAMDHMASEGCIILSHSARVRIGALVLSGNNQLEVTQ